MAGGLVLIGFGVLVIGWRVRAWAGLVLLEALGVSVAIALIVQVVRQHRGWCLLRRGFWFGLAAPGAPLRLLAYAF
jgi:hypothetical protein